MKEFIVETLCNLSQLGAGAVAIVGTIAGIILGFIFGMIGRR